MLQSLNAVATELRSKNAKFRERFRSGDFAGVADNYSISAALLPPNGEAVTGRDRIQEFWAGAAKLGIADISLELDETEGGGDVVAEKGTFDLKDAKGGLIDRGSYLVLWKQEDGDWKMHWDIWNSDRPAV